jgi:hypothetical protein
MSNEKSNSDLKNTTERTSTFGAYVVLGIVLFAIVVYRVGSMVLSEQDKKDSQSAQQVSESLKNNK